MSWPLTLPWLARGPRRYTHTHYDRLTLHVRPPHGESVVTNYAEPGLHHAENHGLYWPLMEQWHPVLESFPAEPVVLDYAAKVCMGDCAVVDAAARVFTLIRDWIVLLVVGGAEEVGLAKSWLCNTRLVSAMWDRTLVVSTHLKTVEALFEWDSEVKVMHWVLASAGTSSPEDHPPTDAPSIRLLSVTRRILERGIPVMLAEPGCVWTADPLLSMPQDVYWDIAAAWDGSQYSMGLAYFQPTMLARDALNAVEAVATDLFRDSADDDLNRVPPDVGEVFTNYVRFVQDGVGVVDLDPDLHASSLWYDERSASRRCILPLSVRARGVEGSVSNSVSTLNRFGQWYIASDESKCSVDTMEAVRTSVQKWLPPCPFPLGEDECFLNGSARRLFARPLAKSAIVYSFVTDADLFFELWIASRYGASIHIFSNHSQDIEFFLAVKELLSSGESNRPLKAPSIFDSATCENWVQQFKVKSDQLHLHSYLSCKYADGTSNVDSDLFKASLGPRSCSSIGKPRTLLEAMQDLEAGSIDLVRMNIELTQDEIAQVLTRRPKYILLSANLFVSVFSKSPPQDYEALESSDGSVTLSLARCRRNRKDAIVLRV